MSLSITQTPATCSLAQSPIPFTLAESNANLLTSSSFQYIGQLYYWTGSQFQSASSADYTITKYANNSGVGIFDVSKILNSTLQDSLINNPSNVVYFASEFYTQYYNGTAYITGSHIRSNTYKVIDGYQIMGLNSVGQPLYSSSYWPLMTDGPATQSVFINNYGSAGVYVGDIGYSQPTKIVYTGNTGTGNYNLSSSLSSSTQIQQYPIAPLQAGFPISTSGLTQYTIQAYSGSVALGLPIQFNIDCVQKYPNVRIAYKNRFGQFDWINFYMVSRQAFDVQKRNYQPQIGSFESATLSYQKSDSSNKNYIVDANSSISVNSWFLPEEQNELIKQLLVSDEIYWIYDEANNFVRPLSIETSNIVFKTGVVDHLIQYQFQFKYGQSYKLIF